MSDSSRWCGDSPVPPDDDDSSDGDYVVMVYFVPPSGLAKAVCGISVSY